MIPVRADWDAMPFLQIVCEGDDLWSYPYAVDSIVFKTSSNATFNWTFTARHYMRLEKVRLVWGEVFREQDHVAVVPVGSMLTVSWEVLFT